MMTQESGETGVGSTVREKIAVGSSVIIIATLVWFWAMQVVSVQETLSLMG